MTLVTALLSGQHFGRRPLHGTGTGVPLAVVSILLAGALLGDAVCPAPAGAATRRYAPGFEVEILEESPAGFELRVRVPEAVTTRRTLADGAEYLEVTLPGFWPSLEAGRPSLPLRGLAFGVPLGATARLEVEVLATETFDGLPPLPGPTPKVEPGHGFAVPTAEFLPDPGIYRSTSVHPTTWAHLGPQVGWRRQRVQTVNLTPVRVAPATGSYEVARELEIRVRFDGATGAPKGYMPAGPARAEFESVAGDVLINAKTATGFRVRPLPSPPPPPPLHGLSQTGSPVRVRIGGSGLARIPYSDLASAGFPVGTAIDQVRLEERGYDERATDPFTSVSIPRLVEDANSNGVFDAGDHLVFYAFNFQDRFQPSVRDGRYGYFHAYWVTASESGGTQFPVRDGFPEGGAWEPVVTFPSTVRLEEENVYINFPPDLSGQFEPTKTTHYWLGPFPVDGDFSTEFTVFDPDPAGSVTFEAVWQGQFLSGSRATHSVSVEVNGNRILDRRTFIGTQTLTWRGDPMAIDGLLADGANSLDVIGRGVQTPDVTGSGALFDYFQYTYDRALLARDDRLLFNSGSGSGDLEFRVVGFSSADVLVLDITDPTAPVRLDAQVTSEGSGFELRLRDTVGPTRKTYFAAVAGARSGLPDSPHALPPDLADEGLIAPGSTRDLLAEGDGSDYLFVTHERFREAWAPLVEHRESQGYRVLLCTVSELYDQFAGGDKTPWAIQRLVVRAFRDWSEAPVFLLLAGDASEDYRTDTANAEPDWVPTMMHLASVPGALQLRELAGTDTWFTAGAAPGDNHLDFIPDLFVGRLPVGSVAQAEAMVEKIIDYESMDPTEDWRNQGVFLADDAYSTSITNTSFYCRKPVEADFERTTREICETLVPVSGGHDDFDCIQYQLTTLLDSVPELNRQPIIGDCPSGENGQSLLGATQRYVESRLKPELKSLLSEGHLIFSYTGHANKNQMTTENLLVHQPRFTSRRDLDDINNFGRPFIYHGFACHLAEFEGVNEKRDGESIGEVLLLAPNRGAIGSIASTGYEWAHLNRSSQIAITAPLFWDIPRDPDTGRPIRLLSHATYTGLLKLVLENGLGGQWVALLRTYAVLGDPALRIDLKTPTYEVLVDGEPLPEGATLTGPSIDEPVTIAVEISDDTDISSVRAFDADQEIPASELTVENPTAEEAGAQRFLVTFEVPLRLDTYDLRVEATDWHGRRSEVRLPVEFEGDFFRTPDCFVDDAHGSTQALLPGVSNAIDGGEAIQAEIRSPVPLETTDFAVFLDGKAHPNVGFEPIDGEGYRWRILASPPWGEGEHQLAVRASKGAQTVERDIGFRISGGDVELTSRPFFYPNPYERGPSPRLHYSLNRGAQRGDLTVYAVSGRRVLRRQVDCNAGRNSFGWDLTDDRGDPVANGVYLFLLEVVGFDGELIRHLEKVAIAR